MGIGDIQGTRGLQESPKNVCKHILSYLVFILIRLDFSLQKQKKILYSTYWFLVRSLNHYTTEPTVISDTEKFSVTLSCCIIGQIDIIPQNRIQASFHLVKWQYWLQEWHSVVPASVWWAVSQRRLPLTLTGVDSMPNSGMTIHTLVLTVDSCNCNSIHTIVSIDF